MNNHSSGFNVEIEKMGARINNIRLKKFVSRDLLNSHLICEYQDGVMDDDLKNYLDCYNITSEELEYYQNFDFGFQCHDDTVANPTNSSEAWYDDPDFMADLFFNKQPTLPDNNDVPLINSNSSCQMTGEMGLDSNYIQSLGNDSILNINTPYNLMDDHYMSENFENYHNSFATEYGEPMEICEDLGLRANSTYNEQAGIQDQYEMSCTTVPNSNKTNETIKHIIDFDTEMEVLENAIKFEEIYELTESIDQCDKEGAPKVNVHNKLQDSLDLGIGLPKNAPVNSSDFTDFAEPYKMKEGYINLAEDYNNYNEPLAAKDEDPYVKTFKCCNCNQNVLEEEFKMHLEMCNQHIIVDTTAESHQNILQHQTLGFNQTTDCHQNELKNVGIKLEPSLEYLGLYPSRNSDLKHTHTHTDSLQSDLEHLQDDHHHQSRSNLEPDSLENLLKDQCPSLSQNVSDYRHRGQNTATHSLQNAFEHELLGQHPPTNLSTNQDLFAATDSIQPFSGYQRRETRSVHPRLNLNTAAEFENQHRDLNPTINPVQIQVGLQHLNLNPTADALHTAMKHQQLDVHPAPNTNQMQYHRQYEIPHQRPGVNPATDFLQSEFQLHQRLLATTGPLTSDLEHRRPETEFNRVTSDQATNTPQPKLEPRIKDKTTSVKRDKRIFCSKCNKSFSLPLLLRLHQKHAHKDLRIFVCRICMQSFPDEQLFIRHKLNHTNERKELAYERNKEISCQTESESRVVASHVQAFNDYYNRTFRTSEQQKDSHNVQETCDSKDKVKQALKGKSLYICYICNRDFSNENNLRQHMVTHKGVKPFQCDKCERGFLTNSSLQHHIICMHSLVHPFLCDNCGSKFKSNSLLAAHVETHAKESKDY